MASFVIGEPGSQIVAACQGIQELSLVGSIRGLTSSINSFVRLLPTPFPFFFFYNSNIFFVSQWRRKFPHYCNLTCKLVYIYEDKRTDLNRYRGSYRFM